MTLPGLRPSLGDLTPLRGTHLILYTTRATISISNPVESAQTQLAAIKPKVAAANRNRSDKARVMCATLLFFTLTLRLAGLPGATNLARADEAAPAEKRLLIVAPKAFRETLAAYVDFKKRFRPTDLLHRTTQNRASLHF